MNSKIKCIRLPAGEEIIGELVEETETNLVINKPASVLLVPGQSGASQFSIGLIPWLPYSDDDSFSIARDKVLTVHNPSIDLLNNYNRMFGSGIQIAAAGSVPSL